jgi:hypothetical protein
MVLVCCLLIYNNTGFTVVAVPVRRYEEVFLSHLNTTTGKLISGFMTCSWIEYNPFASRTDHLDATHMVLSFELDFVVTTFWGIGVFNHVLF